MPTAVSLRKAPVLKGTPGYWVVIAGDSSKVVLQAKTLAEAVKRAEKKGIQQPSYDIMPRPDQILIM
jgi:hypothetical protein